MNDEYSQGGNPTASDSASPAQTTAKDSYDEFCDRMVSVGRSLRRCGRDIRKHWRVTKFHDRVGVIVGVVGLSVLIIYTAFTGFMWRANKLAADAAKKSADTAHDALVLGARPWVGPLGEAKMLGTPIFGEGGNVSFSVEVLVKNSGTSPALNVEFNLEPVVPEIGSSSVGMRFVNDRCKTTTVSQGKDVIFPGNDTTYTTSGARYLPGLKGRPWFTLEGCILYTDQFQERTHHTRFCFVVPYLNKFPVHQCGTTAD